MQFHDVRPFSTLAGLITTKPPYRCPLKSILAFMRVPRNETIPNLQRIYVMSWYKQGTCSVTLNSNAVTGTGTAFIVNCRVGDAFRGPDGRWYEVTNVASNTAISIDPPYIGATASGGSYALAPMQGYVKDSADALRAIVNTYGAQLAALKTTGNYDVLPVSKGGTGGTDQAAGRIGLGLGTAATATVATSDADTTADRLLRNGSHGIGTSNAATGNAPAGGTLGNIAGNGIFSPTDASPSDFAASLNLGLYPSGISIQRSAGVGYQFAMAYGANGVAGCSYRRKVSTNIWSNWFRVFSADNIVGTVSQSGGMPTGAIIERGSNTNGEFTKYADGTIECWFLPAQIDHTVNTDAVTTWTLPFPVVNTTTSVCAVCVRTPVNTQTYTAKKLAGAVTSTTTAQFRTQFDAAQPYLLYFYLKGRWF